MIQFKRLDHILITIPPGTGDAARSFYASTLQLKEIPGPHPNNACWFQVANIQLHIKEELAPNHSDRHPAFEVVNLDAAKRFLLQQNILITYSSEITGRHRCFFHDPYGNRFELMQYETTP